MQPDRTPCELFALDRREFLRAVGGTAAAAAAGVMLGNASSVAAAPTPTSAAETIVGEFYKTLTESQRGVIAFPFEHELRSRVNANWHVTKPTIDSDFFTVEQKQLVREIAKNVCSPDGYERLLKQTEFDDGGIGAYSVAVFGTPGQGKFQWELTGRHLTLRADGDSVDKAAFGGPIVYGHGEEDPKDNLYHYQTKQVNELYRALNPKQSAQALVEKAPKEDAVALQGAGKKYPGLPVSELTSDQKTLFETTARMLLAPYRTEDVDEVMAIIKAGGGWDQVCVAFYQQGDLNADKTWDIWRVEGPSFVWHFRGAPHVHAYINIGVKA